jgi:hypothetical protein
MRRAVAEQIKALQDMSDIIGKSTQQLEISEPVTRHRLRPARQCSPALRPPTAALLQQPAGSRAPPPTEPETPALRGSLGIRLQPRPLAQRASRPAAPLARSRAVSQAPAASPTAAGSAICCVAHRVTKSREPLHRRQQRAEPRSLSRLQRRAQATTATRAT